MLVIKITYKTSSSQRTAQGFRMAYTFSKKPSAQFARCSHLHSSFLPLLSSPLSFPLLSPLLCPLLCPLLSPLLCPLLFSVLSSLRVLWWDVLFLPRRAPSNPADQIVAGSAVTLHGWRCEDGGWRLRLRGADRKSTWLRRARRERWVHHLLLNGYENR